MIEFEFEGVLYLWKEDATWHFVDLPVDLSEDIREMTAGSRGGFGSVKVEVRIGESRWSTSLFPSKQKGCFVLPIKKQVRQAEGIKLGDTVTVGVTI